MTTEVVWRELAYSLRRYYVDTFHFRHIPSLPQNSLILDLGGRKGIRRGQFSMDLYPFRTVYLNLSMQPPPDVRADAGLLPLSPGSFDVVICSEILEHVPHPPTVLSEVHRVLKPGGQLYICVPFLYQIHADPYDYGRYTDSYWRENLTRLGFQLLGIEKQGLFWSVAVDMLRAYAGEGLSEGGTLSRIGRRILPTFIPWAKRFAVKRDAHPRTRQSRFFSRFTTGFGMIARKQ